MSETRTAKANEMVMITMIIKKNIIFNVGEKLKIITNNESISQSNIIYDSYLVQSRKCKNYLTKNQYKYVASNGNNIKFERGKLNENTNFE